MQHIQPIKYRQMPIQHINFLIQSKGLKGLGSMQQPRQSHLKIPAISSAVTGNSSALELIYGKGDSIK